MGVNTANASYSELDPIPYWHLHMLLAWWPVPPGKMICYRQQHLILTPQSRSTRSGKEKKVQKAHFEDLNMPSILL